MILRPTPTVPRPSPRTAEFNGNGGPWHFGPIAVAAHFDRASPADDFGREGCRRLPSLQCRRAGHRRYGVPALHAARGREAARARGISVEGKNVVVVGASNIVGKPMALMLMQRDATVCICHAKTRDLAQFTILADILVVAAGQPNLIVPQMVKTGAVVIDVGINRLPDGRLIGDVDFQACSAGVLHHAGARRRRADDRDHAVVQHRRVRREALGPDRRAVISGRDIAQPKTAAGEIGVAVTGGVEVLHLQRRIRVTPII